MSNRSGYVESSSVSVEYDAGDERMSEAVTTAVAVAKNVPKVALPPLADVIDPRGLDGLFDVDDAAATEGRSKVFFRYAGLLVTVDGGETVRVSSPTE